MHGYDGRDLGAAVKVERARLTQVNAALNAADAAFMLRRRDPINAVAWKRGHDALSAPVCANVNQRLPA